MLLNRIAIAVNGGVMHEDDESLLVALGKASTVAKTWLNKTGPESDEQLSPEQLMARSKKL